QTTVGSVTAAMADAPSSHRLASAPTGIILRGSRCGTAVAMGDKCRRACYGQGQGAPALRAALDLHCARRQAGDWSGRRNGLVPIEQQNGRSFGTTATWSEPAPGPDRERTADDRGARRRPKVAPIKRGRSLGVQQKDVSGAERATTAPARQRP